MKYLSIGPDDADKFDKIVDKENAFVKFYHPNCGHCTAMAPAWKNLKNELASQDVNIIEVHGDATSNIKSPCAKNIPGFPTIMMVKSGGAVDKEYNGDRSTEDMAKFVKENMIGQKGGTRRGGRRRGGRRRGGRRRGGTRRGGTRRGGRRRGGTRKGGTRRGGTRRGGTRKGGGEGSEDDDSATLVGPPVNTKSDNIDNWWNKQTPEYRRLYEQEWRQNRSQAIEEWRNTTSLMRYNNLINERPFGSDGIWEMHRANDGTFFYYNPSRRVSQWEAPFELVAVPDPFEYFPPYPGDSEGPHRTDN